MKTEPPLTRRRFAGVRDEMEYLYHKLLYWMYEQQDRARARAFAERLARLVTRADRDSIFPEECRSLICEARGDLRGAIRHRENEVRLVNRLREISRNTLHEKDVFRLYGHEDLSDRLDLLATLYHDSGDLEKAIATLRESEQLCRRHGVSFDGSDVLEECLKEKRNAALHNGRANA